MIGIKHRCQPSDIEIRLELHTIVVICILDAFFLKLLKNVPYIYSPLPFENQLGRQVINHPTNGNEIITPYQ